MEDIRIPWVDLYLRAIELRCGRSFTETELEGLEFVMTLAREEIEHPTGLTVAPPTDDLPPSTSSEGPRIVFEGATARVVGADG